MNVPCNSNHGDFYVVCNILLTLHSGAIGLMMTFYHEHVLKVKRKAYIHSFPSKTNKDIFSL